MVQENPGENLTENEAILYDRQIRLWGLEAQKRLRKTRLLVIGCQGLIGETVKNITLAGIESLVLCDSEPATEDDVKSNFLIPVDCVGKNRAESSLDRVKILNPTVKVSANTFKISEITEDYLKTFTVVISTNCSLVELNRINDLCRKNNIKFYCGQVWGKIGYYFVDLKHHYYVQEIKKITSKNTNETKIRKSKIVESSETISLDDDVENGNKISSDVEMKLVDDQKPSTSKTSIVAAEDDDDDLICVDDAEKEDTSKSSSKESSDKKEESSEYLEKEDRFPSLREALNVDLSLPIYKKLIRRKRFDPAFFAVLVLLRFRTVMHRNPNLVMSEENGVSKIDENDFVTLLEIRKEVMNLYNVNLDYLPMEYFNNIHEECSPVCAVVGGILAQEIILAISGTEPPHKNFFIFNPVKCSGIVHYIGPNEE